MLDPDLIKRSLIGKTFVSKFYYFDEIESTNFFAKSIKDEDNVLILADHQSQGKGRFGKPWESERGSNLTFSIKKKFVTETKDLPILNYFYAYSIYETLKSFIGPHNKNIEDSIGIKWPNDILAGQQKLAGILVESANKNGDVVAGVGVNVNQKSFRKEYNERTTSVGNLMAANIDLNVLLIKLVQDIDEKLYLLHERNYEEIFARWLKGSRLAGKTIEFSTFGGKKFRGKVIGFQIDGGIKIAQNDNYGVFYSGEIKILGYN